MEEVVECRASDGQVSHAGWQLLEPPTKEFRVFWPYDVAEVAHKQGDCFDSASVGRPTSAALVELYLARKKATFLVLDDFIILPSVRVPDPSDRFIFKG